MASSGFWISLNHTAFADPSAAALWLSRSSIIPTNVSLINELLLKVQQLWKQMDAKVLLMIMKHAIFFFPEKFSFFAAHLFPDLWDMWMINGIRDALELLSLRIF